MTTVASSRVGQLEDESDSNNTFVGVPICQDLGTIKYYQQCSNGLTEKAFGVSVRYCKKTRTTNQTKITTFFKSKYEY